MLRLLVSSIALMTAATQLAAGADHFVSTAADLHQALNVALGGDTITLKAGATFTGYFGLPARNSGGDWITLRSSAVAALPPDGARVSPTDAASMPKLVSPSGGAVLQAAAGAHHYRLVGIEMTVAPGVYTSALISLGTGNETSVAQLPHDLEFDRVYIHGDTAAGGKRGIALNCGAATIKNSWISDFKSTWQDAQAIAGWNGPGPFQILNNYLEASGENIMFGGAATTVAGNVPSDIRIAGNRIAKPIEWQGKGWAVKNLLEFKCARRVTVDGNVIEHNWVSSQNGFAVVFTPRSSSGQWPVVEDVAVTNNIIRHSPGAFNISGYDDLTSLGGTARIRIENNLLTDITGSAFQILNGVRELTINHNTILQNGSVMVFDGSRPDISLVFTNNIAAHNAYGIFGSNYGTGTPALNHYSPGAVVKCNVLAGGASNAYPAGNFFPALLADVGFVNLAGGDYRLGPASPYLFAGTDGKALGAYLDALPGGTSSGGSLIGSGNSLSSAANLTTEGTRDWVHWADNARKAGVTAQISTYTKVGIGVVYSYYNDPRPISWSDGVPNATRTNVLDGLYALGVGNGFSFTAPADTISRTLTVHVGGWLSGGTLKAHLSDGSSADFVHTTALATGQYDRNYTLTYQAKSAGQKLTVTWTMSSGGGGNVTLNAAALR